MKNETLQERQLLRRTRVRKRRALLFIWALKNRTRLIHIKRKLVPADWGIEDGHQNDATIVERLKHFNEYTSQCWQFSPTGQVELANETQSIQT